MTTNLLNNLSNVVEKGTSKEQVGNKLMAGIPCSGVGRISEGGAIEQPLSSHSAPFGIRWKPAGEKGSSRVWKHVAMIFAVLVMSMANIGMAWGAVYKTYALSDLTYTSATLTYEVTGLSSNDQKLNKGERKVEVPCASASGTLYLSGTGANSDRYASIWGSNGTAVDASRKIAMTSGYGSGISFTSDDILTEGGKYYIIFSNVDGSDYKINAFKYVLSSACGGSTKRIYMKCGSTWCNDNPKFYAHSWGSSDSDVELTLADCETDVYYADIPSGNTSVVFTRQSPSSTGIAWSGSNFWNQSEDITISTNNKFTCTGWNNSKGTFSGGTYSAPTYTVTYNKNGDGAGGAGSVTGSVPTDSNSPYACGSTVTVLGNTGSLALDGYTFAGWNTAPGGGGTSYAADATFTISANTTLYAQWEEDASYSVTYNANGATGSVPTDANTYANGEEVTVLGKNTLAKTNYGFAGWRTAVSSGTWYVQGQTFEMGSANVNLYAQWVAEASMVSGTLYKAVDMKASAASATGQYRAGISANGIFEVLGVGVVDATTGPMEYGSDSRTIDGTAFTQALHFKGTGSGSPSGSTLPTARAIKFRVPAAGTLHLWVRAGSKIAIVKSGGSASAVGSSTDRTHETVAVTAGTYYLYATGTSVSLYGLQFVQSCTAPTALAAASTTAKGTTFTVTDGANTNDYEFYVSTSSTAPTSGSSATYTSTSKTKTITDCVAGTTYYAWVRSKCDVSSKSEWTALTGNTFTTSTVTVTHTLTNVTKTSGAATAGGSNYTAVYAAVSGYSLPTPTVTIDGNTATSGTDYTWTAGTGTLTIPANKINGNIVITLNSVPSAPSSAVISGTYHYFPGENISLTCTPSGNNGPTTYQWYKGGKENGNAIEGATSATYTKNSCTFDDAGSYYCKVTCNATSIWAVTNSHENYDVKILRLYVNGSKGGDPYGNVDFVKVNSTTATASISLGSNWTYGFNIADGCGHYYGNSGTMQYNSYGPWVTNQNGVDCGLTTTNAATYVFTINYSNLEMIETTVTFPSGNQTSGKVIYFDNNDLQWENVYYRIGKNDHVQSAAMTKVYGTANLYQYTTPTYNNFAGWHITNAAGATGSYSVYNTKNGTAITEATAFEGAAVTQAAVTVTPTSSHATGETSDNNNCEFYTYGITTGMKTQNVSITAPSNGTITVSYTDVNNAAQSFTSGNADLAHTVIITPTVTPATGYQLSGLTVNGNAHTPGNTYTVTGTTVVAATFTPQVYSITYKDQGDVAFSGTHIDSPSAHPTSHTYGAATSLNGATKDGYIFGGWFTTSACTGDAVTSLGATAYTADITLYAKWTLDSGCKTWAGTPSSWTDNKMTIGSTLELETASAVINTSSNNEVWSGHTETVIALAGSGQYVQGHFTDGSNINTVTVSAANNQDAGNDKEYVIIFCANSSFSSGVTGQTHAAPSHADAQNDAKLVHEFTAPAGTKYFRIYRKVDAIGGYAGGGDGKTTRVYRIEVCPVLCTTPDAPTSPTNGATTSTTQAVSWTDAANSQWEVYVSTSSSTPGSGQTPTASPTTASYTFEGLTASTTYYWWVRSVCDASHKSSWVAGTSFTTSAVVLYTLTYDANGGSVDPSSATQASEGAAITLPTPTRDGYDCTGWWTASSGGTKRGDAGSSYTPTSNETLYAQWTEHVTSECITITDFETSNHNKSDNKPDSEGKYFYGYKGTKDAAHAVTITATNGDCIGVNSGAELKVYAGKYVNIYADNTTTGGTPATFSNVTSVSIDAKMINSSYYTTFDIKVGETTIADDVSLVAAKSSYQTFTYDGLAQLSGKIKIINNGSGSSYNFYADNIQICTADMAACTTPTLPTATLNDQNVCPGNDIAEWDATPTNASTITGKGESVSYSWKKKGSETVLGTSATLDLGSTATESQSGTYVVTVTVSKAGYTSVTVSKELELSVTAAVEEPVITSNKATVYAGNSVTLTATAAGAASWAWYTCNSEGGEAVAIVGETSAAYTFSAPAAGTHYYKVVATGACGGDTQAKVYTLTVTAASECENYYWFIYADDAETNGVINNRDGFFSNTSTGTGNTGTYTMTVDGVSMTGTKRLSTAAYAPKFTVPAGATATLYIYGKAASSDAGKHLVLKRTSDDEEVEVTSNTTVQGYTKENIEAGEWTLSCGSSNWCYSFFAVKVCSTSSCTDATPTIAAVNNTVCSGTKMRIDATGYETGATFKWQKLNTSTSSWDDVAGATLDSLVIASVTASNAGSYRCVATKVCARTSNTVTIAVPSAPNFGSTVPASVTVMQTIALSISTVEASDAVKYRWYKSADATWDAGDAEIGTEKNLIKAYAGEATGSPSYYVFCRAQNSCGTTTSSAIAINVIAYVEEDCAIRGNENEAEFGFENTGMSSGTLESKNVWYKNSNSNYLTYTVPTGKYFKTAKVTIANSGGDNDAGYAYSTDNGSSWTGVTITGMSSTLTEKTINLSAHGNVTNFRIGRKVENHGSSSGTFYLHKACFEYTESCTATTVTVSGTGSEDYTIGGGDPWSAPTFTVKHGGTDFDPQPTLTYTSSDEDIATVDDDGTVSFQNRAGTVVITAAYAGDATYCASQGSYTINVSCPGGAPKVVADGSTDMSGCNTSVTLHAKQSDGISDFADGTYQWFRNGTEIDDATSSSYTATQAGIYTVERTNASGCTTPSTNSATVTSETTEPEVERLVPFQYYHVDKTYTNYMKMRHLFAVKNSGKLDGKSFKLYVSRNGGDPTDVTSSNALAIWPNADGRVDSVMVDLNKLNGKYSKGDELVYTCKAIDCSGNVSETYKATIQMHVIGATPTLALICSGSDKEGGTRKTGELTVGGDFLTGYNKADLCVQTGSTAFDKTQEWGLYTELKEEYIVTPVNGYAPFYKLNYEPFDILFLTDYPKASKSDAAKDILDDMAALCDYRPLFSFKTHMVAKSPSKWAAKGFTTSATENKADGRLNLNIVCYAHPMFDAIKTGDDVYNDTENTSAPLIYTMLSGTGHEGNKGMQGFEIAAAENFVTIGLTHYNAEIEKVGTDATWTPGSEDRMLVTVAERQTNIEARMILFSLNAGAHSKLTDKGEQVVLACLSYLLDDDPLHVADCSFTFDNGASNEHNAAWYAEHCPGCTGTAGDGKWSTAANWAPDYRLLPGEFTSVRIAAPVTVDLEHAHVLDARIKEGGHITIPAGKALEMKGTIRRLDGSEISPTENEDIFLASNASGNGSLIFNNDKGDSKATVAMYTTALADIENMSATTSTWQYIGTPHNDVARATYNYYDSWLYQYSGSGWEVIPNGGPLVPFRGYCVTHPQANHTFVMYGTLTATTNVDIDVPAGYTVIANSWVAPIDITTLTNDDMEGIDDKTIYFFNTGSDAEGENGTGTAPGTYVAVPKNAASYVGNWQIPSMQGFYLSSSSAGTLHLDYGRHVRPAGERTTIVNNPMYAPRRAKAADEEPLVLKMFARGSRYHDKLVVLERADFTTGYDSGWDGEAWGGSDLSPQIYVIGGGRYDAVSAIPDFEGTVVAFRAGEDEEYTIDFIYDAENEPLYLFDTENNSYTQIVTDGAYHFTTSDKAEHSRFILTRHAPQIATGCENLDGGEGAKAKKLLIEDKMFIMVNGLLYDATGKVVK